MSNKFFNRKFAGKINIIIVVLLLTGCRTDQGPENVGSMKRIQIWKETEEALYVYANIMDDRLQEYVNEAENEIQNVMEKQVQEILEQNSAVWSEYLQNYPAEIKWIDIYRFDFTGDGQDEIILSMEYAQNDVISYNYVFDLEGNQIMKFPWGWLSNTEIYCGEDKNTYYLQVGIHYGASDDATLYGRITKQEQWQFELMFLEWDVRSGAERVSNQKERYYIYDNFSVEEAENIWDGIQGIKRIYAEKEKAKDREQLESYLKIYESWEKREAACVQISDEEYINKGLSDIASMSEEEITDYIIEYSNGKYKNYKSVLWMNMLEEVQRYFPHIKYGEWIWEVVGKSDNDYLIEIYSFDSDTWEKNDSFMAQMLLETNGTMKILENTVCTQPQNGLCVYASDIQYLYHGCAIREYNVELYNEEKDIYLKAVIPLFSLENSIEWNKINRNIWEGLETWLNEQTNLQSGNILLNYEIRNLDNNLFSIFMQGSYETEGAESRQIALGMTVSLDSEELVSGKFLGVDTKQDSYFDFYVEDDRLYFIDASQSIDLQYYTFEIDRNQRNVYTSDGRWVGECYYELPQIKPGVGELAIINDKLKEDMGRFFCGAARDFEVSVLEIMEGNDEDMAEIYGGPGYRCNVESKVTLDGDGKLGITYLYTINLGAIQEKGEAGVIYDIETGKTLEYEDWQASMNLR